MKRLLAFIRKLNWKYILGEIALLFVGINLAIGFNNWNSSSQLKQDRKLALNKISEEIKSNREELHRAKIINARTLRAFAAYNQVYAGHSTEVIATKDHMQILQDSFPDFFRIKSSEQIQKDTFRYLGGSFINLELPALTDIAWTTSQSIDITNLFNYDCLYQLASTYQLQKRLSEEMDSAAQALQDRRLKDLIHILEFAQQFEGQLEEDFQQTLAILPTCHRN